MNNKTQINMEVYENDATMINSSANPSNFTVLNQVIGADNGLENGTLLCEKYVVLEKMEVTTGEADLYLCSHENQKFVAKVYRRPIAIKDEVIQALKKIDSPYVAKIYEYGTYKNLPFEIIPYYKNGSLQGKKFIFDELKKDIIPNLNEGLHALHVCGIIHKDIKPSNIMLTDNGKNVSLIDFGISSVKDEGNTVIVTKTGMTPEYSAPEAFRNLYLEESDYYSLGISIYELFYGHTPYKNMKAEEIEQYISVQRIPIPRSMPKELSDLISGITYYDITNRKNKKNPNRRWTYVEVSQWCQGNILTVPGEGMISASSYEGMPPYMFLDKQYTDISALGIALAENWESGKKHLFRGQLSTFFRTFNAEISAHCLEAELEATKNAGRDDIIFMKFLYAIIPGLKALYWKGTRFESLPALGREMLERLRKGDVKHYQCYDSILSEKILSKYVEAVSLNDKSIKAAVEGIESIYKFEGSTKREKLMTYYLMAYMLSGQKILDLEGIQYKTIGELATYMKDLLSTSYEKFQSFCHCLIDDKGHLDVQLESWLISIGKRKELEAWKETLYR